MPIAWNEVSPNSFGGTENIARKLERDIPKEILDEFQVIPSRVRELDETKVRILWLHDLPHDPESEHLKNGGWKKFHALVFVSYWQRDQYIRHFNIPHSKCFVIPNGIDPIEPNKPKDGTVRLIYHTTPHRGLHLLVPVVDHISKTIPNIHLDVFSSFGAYGWQDRDKQFEPLFDAIRQHPNMTYHGFQPNDVVREALAKADIFAYPNTWLETSCMSMMEAMSAKLLCVHPSFGALPETTARNTMMYEFNEDENVHMNIFHQCLSIAIEVAQSPTEMDDVKLMASKSYADYHYNWSLLVHHWNALFSQFKNAPRAFPEEKKFVYQL